MTRTIIIGKTPPSGEVVAWRETGWYSMVETQPYSSDHAPSKWIMGDDSCDAYSIWEAILYFIGWDCWKDGPVVGRWEGSTFHYCVAQTSTPIEMEIL